MKNLLLLFFFLLSTFLILAAVFSNVILELIKKSCFDYIKVRQPKYRIGNTMLVSQKAYLMKILIRKIKKTLDRQSITFFVEEKKVEKGLNFEDRFFLVPQPQTSGKFFVYFRDTQNNDLYQLHSHWEEHYWYLSSCEEITLSQSALQCVLVEEESCLGISRCSSMALVIDEESFNLNHLNLASSELEMTRIIPSPQKTRGIYLSDQSIDSEEFLPKNTRTHQPWNFGDYDEKALEEEGLLPQYPTPNTPHSFQDEKEWEAWNTRAPQKPSGPQSSSVMMNEGH